MMTPFWKMHGAGNDFILLDGRNHSGNPDAQMIRDWCRRHTGIGADGLIILNTPDSGGDFRMHFFNPDGSRAAMCGNGARCAARLAHDLGMAPSQMMIETDAGPVQACLLSDGPVRLQLAPPKACRLDQWLRLDGYASASRYLTEQGLTTDHAIPYAFADTGVPHAVIECDGLDTLDVNTWGRKVRLHPDFAPHGTNVDFIQITGEDRLRIRTYERGVEAETLACGTGIAAAAVTAVLRGCVTSPVYITSVGGDVLEVAIERGGGEITSVWLTGPAEHVFIGECELTPDAGGQ